MFTRVITIRPGNIRASRGATRPGHQGTAMTVRHTTGPDCLEEPPNYAIVSA